ncbi:MAG: hypothetical protein J6Y36_03850 [Treponema sp.]|nr:hypothetical protein [Treponema sp.]
MKKILKKSFMFFLFSLFSLNAFSQESEEIKKEISVNPFAKFGTNIMINTAPEQYRAPSPVNFILGGGAVIGLTEMITIEPELDFWSMYYFFDGEKARPAEIEHRTATVLCFMLDIPVGFNFYKGNHTFTPGAGLGFLIRFGFLSHGVKSNDPGASGSAQNDVDKINSYFWGNARFLYPEVFFSWDYKITEKIRAGASVKLYIPAGSIISGDGIDGMILNFSARVIF